MRKATFKTTQQTTWKTVVLLLIVQAHQKAEMGVVLFKEFASQFQCLLLLVQVHLMRKLKAARQIILVLKSTLKKLVCVAMAQLKQTVGNSIQILAFQTHHHVK
jgi:hypothetical protein